MKEVAAIAIELAMNMAIVAAQSRASHPETNESETETLRNFAYQTEDRERMSGPQN